MGKAKPEIPQYGYPIHETHCHLDYLEADELAGVLDQARSVGISRILTISVSPENLSIVRSLAANYADVYGTQGIHPHEAKDYSENVDAEIRAALTEDQQHKNSRLRAVGEIGLDYYYDHSDPTIQREVFERQLQIAIDINLPVVIHARDADEDTISILKNMAPLMRSKGVIHSFTAGMTLAETALDLGFCLGFNGIITFNKAENVRAVLAETPLDRILLETDAPYLTPVPYRGKTNEPKYLPFIAKKVAEVKEASVEQVIMQTTANAERVFDW